MPYPASKKNKTGNTGSCNSKKNIDQQSTGCTCKIPVMHCKIRSMANISGDIKKKKKKMLPLLIEK